MTAADSQLRSIVERIERLTEEKKSIGDDINDVYAEAKGNGYDVKALKQIVRERAQDANARAEHQSILDTYRRALGMLAGTPLGEAALEREIRASGPQRRTRRASTGDTRMAG